MLETLQYRFHSVDIALCKILVIIIEAGLFVSYTFSYVSPQILHDFIHLIRGNDKNCLLNFRIQGKTCLPHHVT